MIETTAPQSKTLQRVCIRCGDSNVVSLNRCAACGFDLMSDLQREVQRGHMALYKLLEDHGLLYVEMAKVRTALTEPEPPVVMP